jgi:hypothetical protein
MLYEAAEPVGVITTEAPEQIVALFTIRLGVAFTDTVAATLFEVQPFVAVPVTVGVTVRVPPWML